MSDAVVAPPLKLTLSRPQRVLQVDPRIGFPGGALDLVLAQPRATRPMNAFFGAKDTSDAASLTESMRVFW